MAFVSLSSPTIGLWSWASTRRLLDTEPGDAGSPGTWSFRTTITFWVTFVDSAAAWVEANGAWPEMAPGCAEATGVAHRPAASNAIRVAAIPSVFVARPSRSIHSPPTAGDDRTLTRRDTNGEALGLRQQRTVGLRIRLPTGDCDNP